MDRRRLERLLSLLHDTETSAHLLRRICVVCSRATGADGAGVSGFASGVPNMVAASDATAESVEALQTTLLEGPCVDACLTMQPSLEPMLEGRSASLKWPQFSPRALRHGVRAIFAFPVVVDGRAVGALDLYSRRSGELTSTEVDDALLLAELASLTIERSDQLDVVGLTTEAAQPWTYSAVVHNATGMIAAQLGVGVDEALLRLRASAFASERSVTDIARDVVERRLRLDVADSRE